ncbi:MAG: OmpA family protein [Taibaiella sp.]|nr:OmpA family protein [Taibaiella sp.]
MRKFVVLCLVLLLSLATQVQAGIKRHLVRGNYYYNHGYYFKAIPHLEKVVAESGNVAVYTKLADCYNITNDRDKAAKTYARAVAIRNCKKDVWLRYANVLMQLGRYEEASKWLAQYKEAVKKTDAQVDNLIVSCSTAADLAGEIPSGIITFLPFNTDGSEFAPVRWKDFLVFAADNGKYLDKKFDASTGNAFYDIFCIRCTDSGTCQQEMLPLMSSARVSMPYYAGPATFSPDGLTMYYTRTSYRGRKGGKRLNPRADTTVTLETMIATYDTQRHVFGDFTRFQHNNKQYAVAHASVSPNGKVMALVSDMPRGKGRSDIYLCKAMPGGKWSTPVNAGDVINTEGDELFPSWMDDSTLSFSSDGHLGLGGLDMYTTHWDATTGAFSALLNPGIPLNSSFDDISLALRSNEDNTWFSSNRPGEKLGDNVYFYRKMELYLRAIVVDSATGQPLPDASFTALSAHRKISGVTEGGGSYFRERLYPGDTYTISASSSDYYPSKTMLHAFSLKPVDTFVITVPLAKRILVKDTIAITAPDPVVVRNENVMDSPGIRSFELDKTYEVGDFQYSYGKYQLNRSHQRFLDTMMAQLQRHPTMRIEIQAHTDCRGSVASNKILSDKRALSVVNYFLQHGIAKERVGYIGLGNTRPKVPCPDCNSCTEQQHTLNRILEFKVLQL